MERIPKARIRYPFGSSQRERRIRQEVRRTQGHGNRGVNPKRVKRKEMVFWGRILQDPKGYEMELENIWKELSEKGTGKLSFTKFRRLFFQMQAGRELPIRFSLADLAEGELQKYSPKIRRKAV